MGPPTDANNRQRATRPTKSLCARWSQTLDESHTRRGNPGRRVHRANHQVDERTAPLPSVFDALRTKDRSLAPKTTPTGKYSTVLYSSETANFHREQCRSLASGNVAQPVLFRTANSSAASPSTLPRRRHSTNLNHQVWPAIRRGVKRRIGVCSNKWASHKP